MPPKKTKNPPRRQRKARRARVPRKVVGGNDGAKIVTRTAAFNINANKGYSLYNFSLTNSERAKGVAKWYQEYRIAKVECTFKPAYDTFPITQNVAVPHLYMVVDKLGVYNGKYTDLFALKQAGASARRLDDKLVKKTFTPGVLLSSSDSGSPPAAAPTNSIAGSLKVAPWLPTGAEIAVTSTTPWTANSIDHRGLVIYVDMPNAPIGTQFVGQVEVVLHYQFRKALAQATAPLSDDAWAHIDCDTMTEVPKPL